MVIMSKPIAFEAVKLALKQDKNGNVLTLAIHPDETPDEIWRSRQGTRYGVALVPLDEEAAAHADEAEGERAFRMAAARCRDKAFQAWLGAPGNEEKARSALKAKLGIASSTEIRDNPVARERFLDLVKSFEQDRRPTPR